MDFNIIARALVLTSMGLFAFLSGIDFLLLLFKSPYACHFSTISHRISFIFTVIILTYLLT